MHTDKSVDAFLRWELKTSHYQRQALKVQGSAPVIPGGELSPKAAAGGGAFVAEGYVPSAGGFAPSAGGFAPSAGGFAPRSFTRVRVKEKSWILMQYQVQEEDPAFHLPGVEKFLAVQKELSGIGLPVPQILAVDKKAGLLLVEDLGERSLETVKQDSQIFYRQALDQMIHLQEHRMKWGKFSKQDFFKELLWTKTYLVDAFYHFSWDESFLSKCFKEWEELCVALASFPYRPAHRDYHSQNLFIKNDKVYWIDFQDAGLFPRCYDLASLLYDPYVLLPARGREDLTAYLTAKRPCSQTACREELPLVALQRLFKACGSFAGFYCLRGQSSHLHYIRPSLKMIRDLLQRVRKYPCCLELVQKLLQSEPADNPRGMGA